MDSYSKGVIDDLKEQIKLSVNPISSDNPYNANKNKMIEIESLNTKIDDYIILPRGIKPYRGLKGNRYASYRLPFS